MPTPKGPTSISPSTACSRARAGGKARPSIPIPSLPGTEGAVKARPALFQNCETVMKISGVDIRPGNIIEYEGGIWRAVKIQHTQPGKGGAYMQVELKNLIDGRTNNVRFRSAATVDLGRRATQDYQLLSSKERRVGNEWDSKRNTA